MSKPTATRIDRPMRTEINFAAVVGDDFAQSSLYQISLESEDIYQPSRTPSPPPPPDIMPLFDPDGRATIYEGPEWDDGASISSQDSAPQRSRLASCAFFDNTILSSQKNPFVDCALNIYTALMARVRNDYAKCSRLDVEKNLPAYYERCATVTPDFFYDRQKPPMAATPQQSQMLVDALLEKKVLRRPPLCGRDHEGVLDAYVDAGSLQHRMSEKVAQFEALHPSKIYMTVTALNMSRDAGVFEFFELKEIYGFRVSPSVKLDLPVGYLPKSTKEACLMRSDCAGGVQEAIANRKALIAARKKAFVSGMKGFSELRLRPMPKKAN